MPFKFPYKVNVLIRNLNYLNINKSNLICNKYKKRNRVNQEVLLLLLKTQTQYRLTLVYIIYS